VSAADSIVPGEHLEYAGGFAGELEGCVSLLPLEITNGDAS